MKKLKLYKYILVPAVLLSLQSCFVAKDYNRREMEEISEDLFRTDMLPQDSLSMAEVSWRDLFTDPILLSHIERGLDNNIDIRIALQQILAAEAYVKQGKAAFLPTLNANAGVNHQIPSKNSQFGAIFGSTTQYEITGNLSWEADIWGRIRSNKRAFEASYLQSVAAHQAVKTALVAEISSTYFQLLALDEQRRITLETIGTRESSLETTQALKEAGNVTEVGVLQTEAQLYTAQVLLIEIENQIRLLENRFSILLGEAPHSIARGTFENQQLNAELRTGIPSELLRNRPDVLAAEYQLINAFELTNVARSQFYPSLNLTASGGFQSLEMKELFSTNSLFANLAGSLLQPIINGRQIRTAYEVSQAQQEQALLNFEQSLLVAGREVSDALYNYEASTNSIEIRNKEFQAYDLATEYSEELLNSGFSNYLEVLRSRENALNSRLGIINAELDRLLSVVDLYRALGGGWQ